MGKRLGQYFLKDKKILAHIAREALAHPTPCVIEVGPGHGELTDALLESGATKVVAIEKDTALVSLLRTKYGSDRRVEIVEGDVRILLPTITTPCVIAGNIPYYLTGYLLRLLGEFTANNRSLITKTVLLVQKEVAERASAEAPRMNLLAATLQGWARSHIAFTVPRSAFAPPPKVNSALLVLTPTEAVPREHLSRYFQIMKVLFRHPRKTLVNNLASGFSLTKERAGTLVHTLGFKENARAAELTAEHAKTLAKMMYN